MPQPCGRAARGSCSKYAKRDIEVPDDSAAKYRYGNTIADRRTSGGVGETTAAPKQAARPYGPQAERDQWWQTTARDGENDMRRLASARSLDWDTMTEAQREA